MWSTTRTWFCRFITINNGLEEKNIRSAFRRLLDKNHLTDRIAHLSTDGAMFFDTAPKKKGDFLAIICGFL